MYRKDFLVLHLKSTAAYSTICMVYKDPKLAGAALGQSLNLLTYITRLKKHQLNTTINDGEEKDGFQQL